MKSKVGRNGVGQMLVSVDKASSFLTTRRLVGMEFNWKIAAVEEEEGNTECNSKNNT